MSRLPLLSLLASLCLLTEVQLVRLLTKTESQEAGHPHSERDANSNELEKNHLHLKLHHFHSEEENEHYKATFNNIYSDQKWGPGGRGSGSGSTLAVTELTRAVVRVVATNYSIQSMIDAPCGAMEWQPLMLEQIQEDRPGFQYLGVDIVESVVEANRERFSQMPNWQFESLNLVSQILPEGFDLILSRDALQHLPCHAIVATLHNLASAKPKYLLLGSYDSDSFGNINIPLGGYFSINLRAEPFNLADGVIHTFEERTERYNGEPDKKLLLFEGDFFSTIDFLAMKDKCPQDEKIKNLI